MLQERATQRRTLRGLTRRPFPQEARTSIRSCAAYTQNEECCSVPSRTRGHQWKRWRDTSPTPPRERQPSHFCSQAPDLLTQCGSAGSLGNAARTLADDLTCAHGLSRLPPRHLIGGKRPRQAPARLTKGRPSADNRSAHRRKSCPMVHAETRKLAAIMFTDIVGAALYFTACSFSPGRRQGIAENGRRARAVESKQVSRSHHRSRATTTAPPCQTMTSIEFLKTL